MLKERYTFQKDRAQTKLLKKNWHTREFRKKETN